MRYHCSDFPFEILPELPIRNKISRSYILILRLGLYKVEFRILEIRISRETNLKKHFLSGNWIRKKSFKGLPNRKEWCVLHKFKQPNFGRKKRLNFGFRPKIHSEFTFFFFFFFWRSPNFGRKKRLNFGFQPKIHSEFWRRPFFFFFFGDHLIWVGKNCIVTVCHELF